MDQVLQQMQKERAPAQRKSVEEIIKTEIENNNSGGDWKQVFSRVTDLVQYPEYRVLRANNSLFLIHNEGNGRASVYMFNADTVSDMPKSMLDFTKAMKAAKFHTISFNTVRPAVLRLLKSAGINFKSTPSGPEPKTGMPSIYVEVEI
jgi:hypothetical protein